MLSCVLGYFALPFCGLHLNGEWTFDLTLYDDSPLFFTEIDMAKPNP